MGLANKTVDFEKLCWKKELHAFLKFFSPLKIARNRHGVLKVAGPDSVKVLYTCI